MISSCKPHTLGNDYEFHEQSTIQFYNKVSQTRKRRKTRTTFSNSQLSELENNFHRQKYLTPSDRDRIAKHLGLTNTQVTIGLYKL
ncbi:unnamed protein product [Trichobilharzia regenti]|nr:unnamed protein product [Trichobilharzia regenti]